MLKLYVQETGTDRLRTLFQARGGNQFAVLSICKVELRSGLRRRGRAGDTDDDTAEQVLNAFASHMATRFLELEVTDTLIQLAGGIVDRHPLRTLDAL